MASWQNFWCEGLVVFIVSHFTVVVRFLLALHFFCNGNILLLLRWSFFILQQLQSVVVANLIFFAFTSSETLLKTSDVFSMTMVLRSSICFRPSTYTDSAALAVWKIFRCNGLNFFIVSYFLLFSAFYWLCNFFVMGRSRFFLKRPFCPSPAPINCSGLSDNSLLWHPLKFCNCPLMSSQWCCMLRSTEGIVF